MKKRKKLLTTEDATPAVSQHRSPCTDCPLRRDALKGWLGGDKPDEYLSLLHSDVTIDCHVHEGVQCAGAAIYRANVGKRCRDSDVLTLGQDRIKVFSTPMEFKEHHERE